MKEAKNKSIATWHQEYLVSQNNSYVLARMEQLPFICLRNGTISYNMIDCSDGHKLIRHIYFIKQISA